MPDSSHHTGSQEGTDIPSYIYCVNICRSMVFRQICQLDKPMAGSVCVSIRADSENNSLHTDYGGSILHPRHDRKAFGSHHKTDYARMGEPSARNGIRTHEMRAYTRIDNIGIHFT